MRVRREWDNLVKTRQMTALQFEAEWEKVHADLEECGLGLSPTEKFLGYIVKVGPPYSESIRMDRRPRPDGNGGIVTRLPETWEECHEVLVEHETIKAGTKAFNAARAAGLHQDPAGKGGGGQGNFQGGLGGKKGKGGKGGKKGDDRGPGGGKGEKVCFQFRDTGSCSRGDVCPFDHVDRNGNKVSKKPVAALRPKPKPKREPKPKADAQNAESGGAKGKRGGKGAGRGGTRAGSPDGS